MKNSHYRILGEVGQGQFGKVFCGYDRSTGQLLALKSLDHLRFPTHNFLKELAILVRLNHPNIVSFRGVEYRDAGRYIVMDYCQGGTLRQLLESKTELSFLQKLGLVQDTLRGIEHIHQHQIVHCDLKPENILLDATAQGWSAKIADFGIARFTGNPEARNTSSGDTGSPAYMAPERFYGRYSPASDLYAVGVLLYELVSGQRPFSGMPADVMKAHLNQPLRIPKPLPTLLKVIIRKALQKLPQHRYSSATEMMLALEAVIVSLRHADPPSTGPQSTYSPQRQLLPKSAFPSAIATDINSSTFIRQLQIRSEHLQLSCEFDRVICGLWSHPQGCTIATQSPEELTLWLKSQTEIQSLGTLPIPRDPSGKTPRVWVDIEPQGRWLAMLYGGNAASGSRSDPALLDSALQPSFLKICKLSHLSAAKSVALERAADRVWVVSSRHLLVARTLISGSLEFPNQFQRLEFWNRRGHFYWAYDLEGVIKAATLGSTARNYLFAAIEAEPSMGMLIQLSPLKIKRIPLDVCADWVCAARWGYILGDRSGSFACLNRRGRTVAQAQLPLEAGCEITAVAFEEPATLAIAVQCDRKAFMYRLDLGVHLPRALMNL
ncbi:serine/threonine-protein kinase [Altericista sp. CCNU0014]|uniref:serine/threonine-protein kinase n=1 Tax=Altericista sp. CCNU0014 TaxID=3082949 RepID=UPI00384E9D76